ncbi:MAG TPA: TolC family protein [Bryobacteraceae bacterium]
MLKTMALFLVFLPAAFAQNDAPDLLHDIQARPAMRIEQFEQIASTANPTLQQATALVNQAAGQAKQAGLYPNPTVGYQGEQIRGGSFGGGEQGAFVQQTFVLGGKLGLRRNAFEQQRRSAEIGMLEQKYRVLSDVDQSFYSALAAQELVNARKRLLVLTRDALATARQLGNVGQADAPDVLQAEVESERAALDYVSAQRFYLGAFHTLAATVGKPDLPVSTLAGNLEVLPALEETQLIGRILRDSPSVKRAEQDVARAEAELKSAKRESIPDLEVRGGIEQNFEHLSETSNRPVGAQGFASAGINLPIFNRNQGNVAATEAALTRARAEVSRVRLALRQSTEPLLEDYLSARFQAARYKSEVLPRAAHAYQLYLDKYRQMAAAYPQVLVSQRTLFDLQVEYIGVLEKLWNDAAILQNYGLSAGLAAPLP